MSPPSQNLLWACAHPSSSLFFILYGKQLWKKQKTWHFSFTRLIFVYFIGAGCFLQFAPFFPTHIIQLFYKKLCLAPFSPRDADRPPLTRGCGRAPSHPPGDMDGPPSSAQPAGRMGAGPSGGRGTRGLHPGMDARGSRPGMVDGAQQCFRPAGPWENALQGHLVLSAQPQLGRQRTVDLHHLC